MGKLETLRDVLAIIRDFLLIIVLLGLIIGTAILVLLLMNLMQAVQAGGLSGILPMVGGLVAGKMGPDSGSSYSGTYSSAKYDMDSKTQQIFTEIGDAMNTQDMMTVSSKLDELENHFKSKNMNDAADLANKIKSAMLSGNMSAIQTYGSQLMGLFKQTNSSNYDAPRPDELPVLPN
jgi:hypothetical protein